MDMFRNKKGNEDCECLHLDSGRVFCYWARAKFKTANKDSLQFIEWIDY